jgi:hypothetical protein
MPYAASAELLHGQRARNSAKARAETTLLILFIALSIPKP